MRPPPLGDVGVHRDKAAARDGIALNLQAGAVRANSFTDIALVDAGQALAHLGLDIDRSVIAFFRQKSDETREIAPAPQKLVGEADQREELLVPRDHLEVAVEQSDTLRHVVEHNAQGGLPAGKLLGALRNDLFKPGGGLGTLEEELVELDCVLSKYLDRPTHRGNLVGALGINDKIATAAGDRCHAATEPGEARDDVTSDIEPHDQEGARQAQRCDGEKDVSPKGLHARRFGVGAVDLVLRGGDEPVDGGFQSRGEHLVLGDQTPALGLGRH